MLNAMVPQRHHQQQTTGASSPLLLATSSSNSTSVTTISTSPSSSSSASSHHNHNHNQHNNKHNIDHDNHVRLQSNISTGATTTTATTSTFNTAPSNTHLNSRKTPSTNTTTTTTSNHHLSHHNHHQHNHFHNNSYQSHRYNSHHHYNSNHHNMSYPARPTNNQQRTHSSNHNQQQNQQQQSMNETVGPIPVSSTSSSLSVPVASELTSTRPSTTVSQHRQQPQHNGPPHYVDLHVNAGECVSLQLLDGQEQVLAGPASITMISQQQNPPVPIPVQVPPGHMIHQIADEHGTLKHIILSVMENDDNAQLDSTVITLPQGTFRIDSHGELVSTGDNDGGPLTTLPQQAYFANYDGCPVASYGATILPDSIESATTTSSLEVVSLATATTSSSRAVSDQPSYHNTTTSQQRHAPVKVEEAEIFSAKAITDQDRLKTNDVNGIKISNKDKTKQQQPILDSKNSEETNKDTVDHAQVASNDSSQTTPGGSNLLLVANEQIANKEKSVEMNLSAAETEQVVSPTSISDTPYTAHQILNPNHELDIMNGNAMPAMLSAVDGQLYGYQPCCCCCYCDPQDANNGAPQQAISTSGHHQQDIIIAPAPVEHTSSASHTNAGNHHRMSSRSSGPNLAHANGVMTYSGSLVAPTMQSNMGLSLNVPPTGLVQTLPPIPTQNGLQSSSGGHMSSDKVPSHNHSNKGRGSSSNGYKHHKTISSQATNNSSGDRQQGYGNHYNPTHQSYNNIVSGGSHHHGGQHYHHQAPDLNSPTPFKPQNLLSNHGSMMANSYSPAYSAYNHVPATLATVVSSNKKLTCQVAQQASQPLPPASSSLASIAPYRGSDSDNYMQRSRDQVGFSHTNNSYGPTNLRSQNSNEGSKRNLNDKNPNQHNRYTTATNIKVISGNNNHLSNQSPSSSQQTTSVSPIRSRMKGSTNQSSSAPHYHQSHGTRTSHHYNHHNSSMSPSSHDIDKENSPLSIHSNFQAPVRDSKSKTIFSHQEHTTTNSSAPISKHINNTVQPQTGYYPSNQAHKGAWSSNTISNKFNNQQIKNNISSSIEFNHDDGAITFGSRDSKSVSDAQVTVKHGLRGTVVESSTNEQVDNTDGAANNHLKLNHNQEQGSKSVIGESLELRSSRGKQKKCQNQIKNPQSPSEFHSSEQLDERSESKGDSDRLVRVGSLNEATPINHVKEDKLSSTIDENIHFEGKSRTTRDKTLSKVGKSAQKRANREKSSSQFGNKIESSNISKPSESKIMKTEQSEGSLTLTEGETSLSDDVAKETQEINANVELPRKSSISSSIRKQSFDQSRSSATLELQVDSQQSKSKHLSNHQVSDLETSGDSLSHSAGHKKITTSKSSTSLKVSGSTQQTNETNLDLLAQEDTTDEDVNSQLVDDDDDDILSISKPNLTTAKSSNSKPSPCITMRTSLSENNIQLLEANGSSSAKLMSQKLMSQSKASESVSINNISLPKTNFNSQHETTRKKPVDKRRGSSAAKIEQKVKLSSMPQLKILNLNCTSVTSGSVQLRWSYIPSMAEKYGIHNHQSGSKNSSLVDHYVIESSNAKNAETNTLISPKTVYQGCALTCRVNHLSSDKIHHFKVRRTALVTLSKSVSTIDSVSTSNSEHLVVSEILSVTLPSVQQQHQSQNISSPGKKSSSNSGRLNQQQKNSTDATTFNETHHHQITTSGQNESNNFATSSTHSSIVGTNAYRGNTSSHSNSNHSSNSKVVSQPIKFSNLFRRCRTKFVAMFGKLVQNSLSSYSDAKFAGLLLVLFTIFAMLLAVFIHLYIVAPVTE